MSAVTILSVLVLFFVGTQGSSLKPLSQACINAFNQQVLNAHNFYRGQHQAPKLSHDGVIANVATGYARYLAQNDLFQHSNNGYGENLFMAWDSGSSPDCGAIGTEASKRWYEEVKNYDFNRPGFSMATGHFTQVVWKSSRNLGCGLAITTKNKAIVSCNYNPPGNFENKFRENVLPKN